MDRWCFLWSHAQALKQTVQFQPMKFLYWGSGESSPFSSQWCKVWISFSFVVNLKTCWTNSLYDSEYIAYFWFTHEMCCCLYCDVQNETTGVILCWLIVDLFENRPCSCHSRHSKRSISCPPPPHVISLSSGCIPMPSITPHTFHCTTCAGINHTIWSTLAQWSPFGTVILG